MVEAAGSLCFAQNDSNTDSIPETRSTGFVVVDEERRADDEILDTRTVE